jgi:hypothetical protein
MGLAIKYLSELKGRFWFGAGVSPNGMSDAIGMTWDGTDNQMQVADQTVELSLFAGGQAARTAIELLRQSDERELNAHYARELEKLFAGYSNNLIGKPQLLARRTMDEGRILLPGSRRGHADRTVSRSAVSRATGVRRRALLSSILRLHGRRAPVGIGSRIGHHSQRGPHVMASLEPVHHYKRAQRSKRSFSVKLQHDHI